MGFPFRDLTTDGKLNAIYETQREIKELTMALQDQIDALTTRVGIAETAVTTATGKLAELQASVDAEQQQVADAIALLSADNPALADAITKLQGVSSNLDAISASLDTTKADVESTIPDAPAAE